LLVSVLVLFLSNGKQHASKAAFMQAIFDGNPAFDKDFTISWKSDVLVWVAAEVSSGKLDFF
jgi:hypothetical protein